MRNVIQPLTHLAPGLALLLAASFATAATPAFPGAKGFGATAAGGRGGAVYIVRNLCDYLPGEAWPPADCTEPGAQQDETLRWAVEASGPRTVVFEVGGTIVLKRGLRILNPYITIAGQTALGDGITLKNREGTDTDGLANTDTTLVVATNDVVIRHIRVRPGPACAAALGEPSVPPDPVFFPGCELSQHKGLNFNDGTDRAIVDHVSVSWAVDQVLGSFDSNANPDTVRNVTVQHSIVSEGLARSVHQKMLEHSMATLFQGGENISFHHNLVTQNRGRNPRVDAPGPFEFVNNLVYGFGYEGATFGSNIAGETAAHPVQIDFRNNFFHQATGDAAIGGTAEDRFDRPHSVANPQLIPDLVLEIDDTDGLFTSQSSDPSDRDVDPAFRLFSEGNRFWNPDGDPGNTTGSWDDHPDIPLCRGGTFSLLDLDLPWCEHFGPNLSWIWYDLRRFLFSLARAAQSGGIPVVAGPADDLPALLANVGATLPQRDATDARVVGYASGYTITNGEITAYPDLGGLVDAPPMDYGTDPWPPPATGSAPLDLDEDGMADSWESANGLLLGSDDSAGDPDGDVYTNLEEYLNGTDPQQAQPECQDGIDNDGDGGIDFGGDPGCKNVASASESPSCNDGYDNDGDGWIDLDDPFCNQQAWGAAEQDSCGLGFELALVLLPLLALRRRRIGRVATP